MHQAKASVIICKESATHVGKRAKQLSGKPALSHQMYFPFMCIILLYNEG